jgi:hypothetical protein
MSAQGTSYHQKDTIMIRKISALLAAALVLGSASIASAATVTRHAKHHVEHGSVMLLETMAQAKQPPTNGLPRTSKAMEYRLLSLHTLKPSLG